MSEVDALGLLDRQVTSILASMRIIDVSFGKTGVPRWPSVQALRVSGGRTVSLVITPSVLAGKISRFVGNRAVILMMAPVGAERALEPPGTPPIPMIGLSAIAMGSVMLPRNAPPKRPA